ncbi:unnamed protein product [Ranitomeya imitator]|uniref:Transposase n=1 Tax=Ranitomeya imitator TaxID=111125 RepID=A0ABN9KQ15_9NEOB|nr:unnamed protein product [Ranitomeya imitator]
MTTSVTSWKHCSTASAKHQLAVVKQICLDDKPHNAKELWTALKEQADLWLTPLNLQPGMVVCNNGWNLVAALRRGELTHIPCLAHVLNLMVQRFLKTYPELPDLCARFRKSATASAVLAVLQQCLQLPAHRLVCDVPMSWNSTLQMLERIWEQERAAVDYQHEQGHLYSVQTSHIRPQEWTWMLDICTILYYFEDSTKMVSSDDAIISVTIPLLCVLKFCLLTIKEDALQAEHDEMEQGTIQGDYTQPSLISSQCGLFDNEEEEEEQQELLSCAIEGTTSTTVMPSVQRGWPEDREEEECMSDQFIPDNPSLYGSRQGVHNPVHHYLFYHLSRRRGLWLQPLLDQVLQSQHCNFTVPLFSLNTSILHCKFFSLNTSILHCRFFSLNTAILHCSLNTAILHCSFFSLNIAILYCRFFSLNTAILHCRFFSLNTAILHCRFFNLNTAILHCRFFSLNTAILHCRFFSLNTAILHCRFFSLNIAILHCRFFSLNTAILQCQFFSLNTSVLHCRFFSLNAAILHCRFFSLNIAILHCRLFSLNTAILHCRFFSINTAILHCSTNRHLRREEEGADMI